MKIHPPEVFLFLFQAVQEVINNLMVSHIELRSEESIDIQKYVHDRTVEKIVVPLSGEVKNAQQIFLEVIFHQFSFFLSISLSQKGSIILFKHTLTNCLKFDFVDCV